MASKKSIWQRMWDRAFKREMPKPAPRPQRTPTARPQRTTPKPNQARQTRQQARQRTSGWDNTVSSLFDAVSGGRASDDDYARTLFDFAYVDPDVPRETRMTARQRLADWFDSEYGVDFNRSFDWDAWREWYLTAA